MPLFGKRKNQPTTKEIGVVVQQLIGAVTWERSGEIIKANEDVLLSDQADRFLENQIEASRKMPFTQDALKKHLEFLRSCRKSGTESATKMKIASSGNSKTSDDQELSKVVTKLIQTSSEGEALRVIRENPELLDPVVDSYLSSMIRVAEFDNRSREMINGLKTSQSVLRKARSQ